MKIVQLLLMQFNQVLYAGLSLNTSTGIISGTASAVDADTQSSFTIRATDLQSQTADRAFTITIKNQTVASSLVFNKPDSSRIIRSLPSGATQGTRTTLTVSFWIKRCSTGADMRLVEASADTSGNYVDGIAIEADKLRLVGYHNNNDYELISNGTLVDTNAWYHIVVQYDTTNATSSNRIKAYINGSEVTSWGTSSYPTQNFGTYFGDSPANLQLGRRIDGGGSPSGENFDGFMADFNYVDGSVKAPTLFGETDSTTGVWKWKAYTGSHGTTGLRLNPLKTDTVMNTSQFTDESGTGHTVTTSGDTHHRYDLSKFANNPSIYFDGSGDKLAIPDHSDFDFGTGDFTVEFFAYMSNQSGTYHTILNDPAQNRFRVNLGATAATPKLTFYSSTWDAHTEGTTDLGDEAWHHCAVTRESGTINIYVDGSREAQRASSTNDLDISALEIGTYNSGNKSYTGYLNHFRISNTARYSGASYTVPTAAFSNDSNTKLLIQSLGTNRPQDVSDNSNHMTLKSFSNNGGLSHDTPLLNYTTFNKGFVSNFDNDGTYTKGNRVRTFGTNTDRGYAVSSNLVSAGKWYAEIKITDNDRAIFGVGDVTQLATYTDVFYDNSNNRLLGVWGTSGDLYYGGSTTSYGAAFSNGDIAMIALDMENHRVWFGKNGSWFNSATITEIQNGTATNDATTKASSQNSLTHVNNLGVGIFVGDPSTSEKASF